jgi:hypothetical protein
MVLGGTRLIPPGTQTGRIAAQPPSRSTMKTILGLVLIIAGVAVFFQGLNRKDSLAGRASEVGTSVANSIDGGARTPKHVAYMVGGGVLVLVGIGVMTRRGPRAV